MCKSLLVTLTKCKNANARVFQTLKEFQNIDLLDGIQLLTYYIDSDCMLREFQSRIHDINFQSYYLNIF